MIFRVRLEIDLEVQEKPKKTDKTVWDVIDRVKNMARKQFLKALRKTPYKALSVQHLEINRCGTNDDLDDD